MKFVRTPLIFAAVLLVLGGVVMWDNWQTEQEQVEEKEKEEARKLATITAEQVRKITLVNRGEQDTEANQKTAAQEEADKAETVVLEQVDGVWRVVAPLETAADAREVNDFIKTVLDYKYEEKIVSAEAKNIKIEEFGLQEPQRVITLQAEDGSSYELRLGGNAPVGYSTYFQVKGAIKQQDTATQEQIYLGSQYVLSSTKKGLFNFRDKQLLALDVEKVAGVTFWHRESQAYEVTRKDGRFQLVRPEPFKTAQQKVSEYVEAFDQVRAEKFIDTPDADLIKKFKTASKIVMSAVFSFNSGESKELTFVRDRGELLAAFAADKLVFGIPAAFEEKVRDLSENFRDHSIFTFAAAEVVEVDVDGESYRRVGNDWYRSAELNAEGELPEENKPVPNDSVDLLLDSLETAEAIEFVDRQQIAELIAQPPARRIILHLARANKQQASDAAQASDSQPTEPSTSTLEVAFHSHPKNEEHYYISHNDSEQVYVAARSLLEAYTSEQSKDSALSGNASDSQGG